jgi:hypothetical protein
MKLLNAQFSQLPVTSLLFGPNILLSTLYTNTADAFIISSYHSFQLNVSSLAVHFTAFFQLNTPHQWDLET